MTLLESERLIRRISEILQQGGSGDLGPKLAGDYAAACHGANLRLQQCEAMIKAGDRHQAIQLAETAPNLLDLITILEFRNADGWRSYCQQNALPVAERIDGRSVQSLNECYAQGISTDHPLYAAYRKAVLNRNDEDALKTLQSITRLNPSDSNAASELTRLDAKVLAKRLEQLAETLNAGDASVIVLAVEAIEAFGFKGHPEGEIWRKAQTVRSGVLLEEAQKFKAASQWQEVLTKLDLVGRLRDEFKLELPLASRSQSDSLRNWALGEQEKDRKQRSFNSLLGELHFRIKQSEEKDTSARYVKLPEMRDDYEALHKVWRALSDFTWPIPDDATAAFSKRSALLEGEIARRTAIRRRVILASAAAVIVLGSVVSWFVLGQIKARSFAAELSAAISHREVRAAERLMERVQGSDKRLLNFPAVNAAAAAAETFLTHEHARLADFEKAFQTLPIKLNGEPEAARINEIATHVGKAHSALDALAPDLKTENEPRVAAFETQWRQFLSESSMAVNQLLSEWVGNVEKLAARLDYRSPAETAAAVLAEMDGTLQKINACEAGLSNHVKLRGDLLQRSGVARGKFTAYSGELGKIRKSSLSLQQAHTFEDFSAAINLLASSEFSSTPEVSAAASIRSLAANPESSLRLLLGATNAGTWAFIKKGKPASLVPEIAMPAERAFFERLNGDPAVSGDHHHYRLWLDRLSTKSVEWYTSGTFEDSQSWRQIRAWTPVTTATTVLFEDREYGSFSGQLKLSPTQPVYRLEHVAVLRETDAYGTSGVAQFWSETGSYSKPLLEVLDTIKDSRDGSPLFRAYLLCNLVDMMELQPDAWGLSFCPSARAHAAEIISISGGKIVSGDWFLPLKAKACGEKLEQFFASQKALSYAKQAKANLNLAQAAARDGLRYVGFISLDRKPVFFDNPQPTETWCYSSGQKQPTLITASAMPFSPLFSLPASRAEYLAKAGINGDQRSSAGLMPPMFR